MPTAPTLLAFDTSAAHCAAALLCGTSVLATRFEEMGRGQAERLFPLLREMLDETATPWSALDAIGVGIGPGNFTGIRISVSAARGLALSLGIPAIGVSTFELLRGPTTLQDCAAQLVSLPAPRDTTYVQMFANGAPAQAPRQWALPCDPRPVLAGNPPPAAVLGHQAREIAALFTDAAPIPATLPVRNKAEIIGQIALAKLATGADQPAPAPLYVRAADAAPSSDPPPVILDDT